MAGVGFAVGPTLDEPDGLGLVDGSGLAKPPS